MKYLVCVANGRAEIILHESGAFRTEEEALAHIQSLGLDADHARRTLRFEEKWDAFMAMTTGQKIVAFLFNLTTFPPSHPMAKLQAATLAGLIMGTVVLIAKLMGRM